MEMSLTQKGLSLTQLKSMSLSKCHHQKQKQSYILPGYMQFLGPHICCLSNVTMVLRQINKENVNLTWNSTYERAFRQAKLQVANAVTLQYFNPAKPIVLECDASGNGFGRSLLQDGQTIVFVSQALTDT